MIFLSLGTNMGDREANLAVARAKLSRKFGVVLSVSQVLETKAMGFDGADFLNQVVAFQSDLSPKAILYACQQIEVEMGRKLHTPRYDGAGNRIYQNRIIDIDILTCGNVHIHTAELTIPHTQCYTRRFIKDLLETMDEKIQKEFII